MTAGYVADGRPEAVHAQFVAQRDSRLRRLLALGCGPEVFAVLAAAAGPLRSTAITRLTGFAYPSVYRALDRALIADLVERTDAGTGAATMYEWTLTTSGKAFADQLAARG